MNSDHQTQQAGSIHSRQFVNYMSIAKNKPLHRILYFEDHQVAIQQLETIEYYPMVLDYLDALFVVKSYSKYAIVAQQITGYSLDPLLERDSSTIESVLQRSAVAAMKTHDYTHAAHICKELLGINPLHVDAAELLKTTWMSAQRQNNSVQKAVVSIISIVVLSSYFIRSLLIDPFYPGVTQEVNQFMLVLLLFGVAFVALQEIKIRRTVRRRLQLFMTELHRRKGIIHI